MIQKDGKEITQIFAKGRDIVERRKGNVLVWRKPAAEDFDVWDGSIADSYGGGTGIESDPYLIYTCSQLARVAQQTNLANVTYNNVFFKLMNDLDLNDLQWTAIGWIWGGEATRKFYGSFDENYHTIKNLTSINPVPGSEPIR